MIWKFQNERKHNFTPLLKLAFFHDTIRSRCVRSEKTFAEVRWTLDLQSDSKSCRQQVGKDDEGQSTSIEMPAHSPWRNTCLIRATLRNPVRADCKHLRVNNSNQMSSAPTCKNTPSSSVGGSIETNVSMSFDHT